MSERIFWQGYHRTMIAINSDVGVNGVMDELRNWQTHTMTPQLRAIYEKTKKRVYKYVNQKRKMAKLTERIKLQKLKEIIEKGK